MCFVAGGFDSFRKVYPAHCTQGVPFVARVFIPNVDDDESAYLNWEATAITDNIYVGALHDAKDDALLDKLEVTHILNCCKTASRDSAVAGKYHYLELKCDDNLKQSLKDKLESAFKFIGEFISSVLLMSLVSIERGQLVFCDLGHVGDALPADTSRRRFCGCHLGAIRSLE